MMNDRGFRGLESEKDLVLMESLVVRAHADHMHVIDLPYRFSSWALDDPRNVGLWFSAAGELIAWAVMQLPFWTVDITFTENSSLELQNEVMQWVDHRAHELCVGEDGHPCWFVNVFARQRERIRLLEQAGFASQANVGENSWSKVWMRHDPPITLPAYPAPAGFSVRSMAGLAEVPTYVELHQTVFESKNMTLSWRQRTLAYPGYRNDLDVVVAAPDGRLAAFCIGWLQRGVDGILRGQVEPLGCHTDYRRYALGRVALAEVIQRLYAAGAEKIYVETDDYRDTAFRLYQSMGFNVTEDVLVFRKDYE